MCGGGGCLGGALDTLTEALGALPTAAAGLVEGEPAGQVFGNIGKSVADTGLAAAGGAGGLGDFLGGASGAAGDFGFADASGAFGGLGGAAAPTAGEFGGVLGEAANAAADSGLGFADFSGAFGGLGDTAAPGATGAAAGAGTGAAGDAGSAIAGGAPAAAPATAAPIAGATPAGITDPFGLAGAGGAPGVGDTATATGSASAFSDTFGTPAGGGTFGGSAGSGVGGDLAGGGGGAAPGDFSFADQSGAFGGLNGAAPPTAADFPSSTGSVFGGLKDFLKANKDWLGLAGTGVSVGRSLLKGNQPPGGDALNAQRQQILNTLMQQSQLLASGQLTPEQTQQFMNDLNAHISSIKAKYASLGQPGSTAELQDVAAAQALTTGNIGAQQTRQISTGLQGLGLAANQADRLTADQMAQDQQISDAIARLAAAGMAI